MTNMALYKVSAETVEAIKSLSLSSSEMASSLSVRIGESKEEQTIKGEAALIDVILTNRDVNIPSVGALSFVSIAPDEFPNGKKMLYVMSAPDHYESLKALDSKIQASSTEDNKIPGHIFYVVQNLSLVELEERVETEHEAKLASDANSKKKDKKAKAGYAKLDTKDMDTPGGPDEEAPTPGNSADNKKTIKKSSSSPSNFKCSFFDCFGSDDGVTIEKIQLVTGAPTSQSM